MLRLSSYRRDVSFPSSRFFFGCRTSGHASFAAVEGNVGSVIHDHGPVDVDVPDIDRVHMKHSGVVEECAAAPLATHEASAKVAEPVINPAVESNVRTPEPFVENECVSTPAPPSRSPKIPDLRRQNPRTGNPVIIVDVVVVSPIARSPQISVARAYRLLVNWDRRRTDSDRNAHLPNGRCRHAQHDEREYQRPNGRHNTHRVFLGPTILRFPVCVPATGCADRRASHVSQKQTGFKLSKLLESGSIR